MVYEKKKVCTNCNNKFKSKYCNECGQKYLKNNKSLSLLIKYLFKEISNLDNKVYRTIISLFKPGFLTSEWNKGRLIRYIHPIPLQM